MYRSASISSLSQVWLTALLFTSSGLHLLSRRGQRKASRNWGSIIVCLPQVLLVTACATAYGICLQSPNDASPYHDMRLLASTAVGALTSIFVEVLGGSRVLPLAYNLACCLLWVLTHPLLMSSRFLQLAISGLFFLNSAAIIFDPVSPAYALSEPNPLASASVVSKLTLRWLSPLLPLSTSRAIGPKDIWPIDHTLSTEHALGQDKEHLFNKNIFITVARTDPWKFLLSAVLSTGHVVLSLLAPLLLQRFIEQRQPSIIAVIFFAGCTQSICNAHSLLQIRLVGIRLRAVLTALVCDICVVKGTEKSDKSEEPSVLVEVDSLNVFNFVEHIHQVWLCPVQILLSVALLVHILNWKSVLAGFGSMILILPLFVPMLAIMSRLVGRVMAKRDGRIELVTEVLDRVKHIKLFWWQTVFVDRIARARDDELGVLKGMAAVEAGLVAVLGLIPASLAVASFGTYMALGGTLSSRTAFPALTTCALLSQHLQTAPALLLWYQRGSVSFQRILSFLRSAKEELKPVNRGPRNEPAKVVISHATISIHAATETKTVLQDLNLCTAPGSLTVIIGAVGSGKTTILRAILGDLGLDHGHLRLQGRVAYAPQRPFLINGTVRENILFGLPFEPSFYERVIEAACLRTDFLQLPHGDATFLGGVGPGLSGGQQSRVSLARAIYSRRNVMLLDDPLAAVDAKVQRSLIDNVLGPNGILKDCVRIVTTSNKLLMRAADQLLSVENLSAKAIVTPTLENLPSSGPDEFTELVTQPPRPSPGTPSQPLARDYGTLKASQHPYLAEVEDALPDAETTALIKKPPYADSSDSEVGSTRIKLTTYLSYLQAGKSWGWPVVMFLVTLNVVVSTLGVYFLRDVSEEFERYHHSSKLYHYAACGILVAATQALFVFAAYTGCLIPASRVIHGHLSRGVLFSKFAFFDTTAMGQILSRFTNDINQVDAPVAGGFLDLVTGLVSVFSALLVIVATMVSSILYLVPLTLVYLPIHSSYTAACRQLKRLENVARGQVLNNLGEILDGRSLILAFDQEGLFQERSHNVIDGHIRIWTPFLCLESWLLLRVALIASVVQVVSASALLYTQSTSATLGLVMNFTLQMTTLLSNLANTHAKLEAALTSVERIHMYMDNPSEDSVDNELGVDTSWPVEPTVTFQSYSVAHRVGGPLCLRQVDLHIQARERIAVIGRTGAGKSSLVLALMRAMDQQAVHSGRILIDGVDIATVPLASLRRQIALVPQEPKLFTGSLRENLDPRGERTDAEVLDVISSCSLATVMGIPPDMVPLEYTIDNGGNNLSGGQVQLLAIARVMLSRAKIIILDEATAAIDHKTESIINHMMKRGFSGKTIISIAHRMESVLEYDRILVLSTGGVAEFASPASLFGSKKSIFYHFIKEAGLEERAAILYSEA